VALLAELWPVALLAELSPVALFSPDFSHRSNTKSKAALQRAVIESRARICIFDVAIFESLAARATSPSTSTS
jgi:hypothetical protein